MQPNQGIKAWQWVVTVIVIIILIVLGYYMFKGSNNAPQTSGNEETSTTTQSTTELNRVVVTDQYPGNVVYISSAQFAAPGFVVIHKDNNGTPGAIIGSLYFDKGINAGKITLSEKTVDGQLYYAMLHSDDGDKKFDAAKDLPLKDSNGNVIMRPFRVTTSVTEIKG